ncbi:MAG: endo alpha-1,4 polygalactosaminidase [Kineosporiaceae bacterium]
MSATSRTRPAAVPVLAGLSAAMLWGLWGCSGSGDAAVSARTAAASGSAASRALSSGATTGATSAVGSAAAAGPAGTPGAATARGSATPRGVAGRTSSAPPRTPARSAPTSHAEPAVTLPPAAARFDYQLGGAYDPPAGTSIVVRDAADAPAPYSYGVCYLNAFQSQPDARGWWLAHHSGLLLRTTGGYVEDPDWPGEIVLDTSTPAQRAELAGAVGAWIDGCARKGFEAVEADNLDSWTRSGGLLSSADNVALARLLAAHAHARHLAIAQKNTPELAPAGRSVGFDFAIAEECQVYGECGAYVAAYGSHVLEVEYTDDGAAAFTAACRARGRHISVVLRVRDLVAQGEPGYAYRAC